MPHQKTPGRVGRAGVPIQSREPRLRSRQTHGDSERYDFIVSSGSRLLRVQVKSTHTAHNRVYEVCAHGCWGGKDIYTKDEIDFIVAYVVPADAWYIIPIEATRGRKRLCLAERLWKGTASAVPLSL